MLMSADFPTVASPTTTTLHRSIKIVRCVVSMLLKQLSMGSGTSHFWAGASSSPFSSPTAAIVIAGWRRGCRAAGVARAASVRHRGQKLPPAGLGSSGFGLGALVGWWAAARTRTRGKWARGALGRLKASCTGF